MELHTPQRTVHFFCSRIELEEPVGNARFVSCTSLLLQSAALLGEKHRTANLALIMATPWYRRHLGGGDVGQVPSRAASSPETNAFNFSETNKRRFRTCTFLVPRSQ
jgi:hypothetical protein